MIGLLLLSTSCSGEPPTAPEPCLSVTDQGAISCIDTTIKELVIPDYINGIKVTSIADNGFREYKSLKSITSSESVTSIGENAFTDCSALEEINIHKTEDSISGAPWGASDVVIKWKTE